MKRLFSVAKAFFPRKAWKQSYLPSLYSFFYAPPFPCPLAHKGKLNHNLWASLRANVESLVKRLTTWVLKFTSYSFLQFISIISFFFVDSFIKTERSHDKEEKFQSSSANVYLRVFYWTNVSDTLIIMIIISPRFQGNFFSSHSAFNLRSHVRFQINVLERYLSIFYQVLKKS